MQSKIQGCLYIMLHMPSKCKKCTKESYTYATKELPLKTHKPPAPRGEAKRARHHRQKAKEHKTHKLPLNTCTRAKEHTKLILHTGDREGAKQTKWLDQGHTLDGHKFTYLVHFFTIHSSLSTIPESDVPPCHHRGMRPENHP
jgi:hypothetical protein